MTTVITAPQNLVTEMAAAQGVAGISAYAVAVKNGYTGTEAEWLLTLVGPAWPSTGVQAASEAARDAAVIAKDLAVAAKDTAVLSATNANDDAVAVALAKSSVDSSTTTVTELAAQVNIDVGVISGYKDTVALDKAAVALDKAVVAADKLTVAGYKDTVDLDKAVVALDKAAVAADKLTVSGYKDAVDTDRADVALDKAAVAADTLTVAGYKDTVALDKADVALDKAAVAADKLTVSGYKDTVALDKAAVALDTATVAADKLTVAGYKDTVATDKTDTLGYKNSASDSAVAAALSASNADTSEAMAQAWAITPVDTLVSDVDYSALHWAAKSAESQGIAGSFATSANDAKVAAQAAANNAVAVVTGGTASLASAAGKIPLADGTGKIDAAWLDLMPTSSNSALHRSPNAITAMFVYDTSKDSDGGAWVEKCQHLSWCNETLSGKWLGRLVSEAAARAVSGAVTGDYFQLIGDGKFYRLNAVSGVTEVFRGNKAKWPRLSAIVCESSAQSYANVAIYDLTESGCPMFMSFSGVSGGVASGNMLPRSYAFGGALGYTCCSAINGLLLFGSDTIGFATVRLLEDSATLAGGDVLRYAGNIAQRNSAKGFKAAVGNSPDRFNHRGGWCNSIAVCLPPSAPVNPVTGLTIPLIATAGNLGLSVFYLNSWSAYSSSTSTYHRVTLTPRLLSACVSTYGNWYTAVSPEKLPSDFALSSNTASDALDFNQGNTTGLKSISQSALVRSSGALLQLMRSFDSSPSMGVSATVAPTYNTGYMVGDIRRCYLASTVPGAVSNPATLPDRSYKAATATVYGSLTATLVATGAQLVSYSGFGAANYIRELYSADLDFGVGEWSVGAIVNYTTAVVSTITSRAYASGAYITIGTDVSGKITATAFDGTTLRSVTTVAAYNNSTLIKTVVSYRSGRLAIEINGIEVAATNGAPLLTLNNSNAVLTIGNSYALDAPFPGSITMLKIGATVPTPEQSLWMYEQEKSMFREGAQVCLPEATSVSDLTYDPQSDKWVAVQAGNESSWVGLTRVATAVPSAGTFSKAETKSGIKLLSRATTSPGVDVSMSGQTLIESLSKRAEAANLLNRQSQVFDFDTVGFTCTTVNGQNTMTSVASLVGAPYIGMYVTGPGIPVGTYLIGINGTTYYMSANATASNTVVTTGQTSFTLPAGFTAIEVVSAGSRKREGSTKDWARSYDGFRETVRFAASPGSAAWVQITAKKD